MYGPIHDEDDDDIGFTKEMTKATVCLENQKGRDHMGD
jgi:hypothetical protein